MLNEILLSIIVPVYNTENYLSRCVDSILKIDSSEVELLLIDDGSTDCSLEICKKYQIKNTLVRVFHKKNEGVSSARNLGIDEAKGKWILFIDSDDYVYNETLKKALKFLKVEKYDMIVYDFYYVFDNTKSQYFRQKHTNSSFELLECILRRKNIGSMSNKIIRREIVSKFNLKFDCELLTGEDEFFLINILVNKINITNMHSPLFAYCMNAGESVTRRNLTTKMVDNRLLFIDKVAQMLKKFETNLNCNDYILNIKTKIIEENLNKDYDLTGIYPEVKYKLLDKCSKIKIHKKILYNLAFKGCPFWLKQYYKIRKK